MVSCATKTKWERKVTWGVNHPWNGNTLSNELSLPSARQSSTSNGENVHRRWQWAPSSWSEDTLLESSSHLVAWETNRALRVGRHLMRADCSRSSWPNSSTLKKSNWTEYVISFMSMNDRLTTVFNLTSKQLACSHSSMHSPSQESIRCMRQLASRIGGMREGEQNKTEREGARTRQKRGKAKKVLRFLVK